MIYKDFGKFNESKDNENIINDIFIDLIDEGTEISIINGRDKISSDEFLEIGMRAPMILIKNIQF